MKELQQVVTDKLAEMINNGVVENIIADNLTKTIEESVKTALKTYGEFGKAVSKKIESAIMLAEPDIHLPLYNTLIAERISHIFSKVMEENALSHFTKLVAEIVEPVPKESKFSALMDLIRNCWSEESERGSIEIETSSNDEETALYVHIKHPEYDWYDVNVTFYRFKKPTWHIGYLRAGDKALSIDPKQYANNGIGASKLSNELFKYYLTRTEFEDDEMFDSICNDF